MYSLLPELTSRIKRLISEIETYRASHSIYEGVIADLYAANKFTGAPLLKQAGVIGLIHQASQGLSTDTQYSYRRGIAASIGWLWGAYHFMRPLDGALQADVFLRAASVTVSTLVALDLEDRAVTLSQAEGFVTRVRAQLGRWPVLYANAGTLNPLKVSTLSPLRSCPLWVASFNTPTPTLPNGWRTWKLWQYKAEISLPGVSDCDLSKFNGSVSDLRAWWGK